MGGGERGIFSDSLLFRFCLRHFTKVKECSRSNLRTGLAGRRPGPTPASAGPHDPPGGLIGGWQFSSMPALAARGLGPLDQLQICQGWSMQSGSRNHSSASPATSVAVMFRTPRRRSRRMDGERPGRAWSRMGRGVERLSHHFLASGPTWRHPLVIEPRWHPPWPPQGQIQSSG